MALAVRREPGARPPRPSGLLPVDLLLLGYLAIVSVVAPIRRAGAADGCWWLLVAANA